MITIKKSRCLTCERMKRHTDIVTSRDANKHQQKYPDHHVQIFSDVEDQGQLLKLAPAVVISKSKGSMNGYTAYVTQELFSSYEEAVRQFNTEDAKIIWPASCGPDGFYSVSE